MSKTHEYPYCQTLIDETRSTLHHVTSRNRLDKLYESIRYKMSNGNRKTIIKLLKDKIRQLEKKG